MTSTAGVLALLAEPALCDETDRIAAAVGIRVVHAPLAVPVGRRAWSAAAVVVMDESAAAICTEWVLPRRSGVIVLTTQDPGASVFRAAIDVGAQRVLQLPGQQDQLIRALSDVSDATGGESRTGEVIAVIGGRGGAGASLFAAALAQVAAATTPPAALLVDLDPWGGGIDLLLGGETAPGLRWPDLSLQDGRLSWPALREALPRQRGVCVLSGTRDGHEPASGPVAAVIDAGRRGGVTGVCDLPRRMTGAVETALDTADLVVLVSQADVRSCAATSALVPILTAINPNVGLVVRGPSPGGLRAEDVAEIAALPLLASMRPEPMVAERLDRGGLQLRGRSPLARAARRVHSVMQSSPAAGKNHAA